MSPLDAPKNDRGGSAVQIIETVPDLDEAVAVTSRGFVQPVSDGLVEDVRNHLQGDLVLSLVFEAGLAGYAVFKIQDDLLYLAGAMIDPTYQGKQVARKLIMHAQLRSGAIYFGLRTQSPIMWSAGKSMCQIWLPSMNGESFDDGLYKALNSTLALAGSPRTFHNGCYGGALYGEKPVHHDAGVQDWWDRVCNFEAGDAVVCVGRF